MASMTVTDPVIIFGGKPLRRVEETFDAWDDSLYSVEQLCALPAFPLPLKRRLEHLIALECRVSVLSIAFTATEALLSLKPTKLYLKKVVALATWDIDEPALAITFRHGWPILSAVGLDNRSVAEGGMASRRMSGVMPPSISPDHGAGHRESPVTFPTVQ